MNSLWDGVSRVEQTLQRTSVRMVSGLVITIAIVSGLTITAIGVALNSAKSL